MASTERDFSLTHTTFENEDPQTQSALFRLPGEVRDHISSFILAAYEDESRKYDVNTYWCRPGDHAPRRSDTAFLRTCKKAYQETWFKPWAATDHVFWLTSSDRKPGQTMERDTFATAVNLIHSRHGEVGVENVRFFAQLYKLEPGKELSSYLDLPYFHPTYITITIRHTDWWHWERDEMLYIGADWVNKCRFPASTRQIKMELESLERKKDQIDSMAQKMRDGWCFTKTDGSLMSAKDTSVHISRWKGSSIWAGERWVRDESEPEIIHYYVATVVWQSEPNLSQTGRLPYSSDLHITAPKNAPINSRGYANLQTRVLEKAGIPAGTKADEVVRLVQEYFTRIGPSQRRFYNRRLVPP